MSERKTKALAFAIALAIAALPASAKTTTAKPKPTPKATTWTTAQIQSLITKALDAAVGKFVGPPGPPGPQGPAGAIISTYPANPSANSNGGSIAGFSQLSAANLNVDQATTTKTLNVTGNGTMTGGLTVGSLSTAGTINAANYLQNGVPFAATPGGSNLDVQFNDSGAFGADSGLTYDKATGNLNVSGNATADGLTITGLPNQNCLGTNADGIVGAGICGGGGASPAGSDTQVQLNSLGAFGASPDLIFQDNSNGLSVFGGNGVGSGNANYAELFNTVQTVTDTVAHEPVWFQLTATPSGDVSGPLGVQTNLLQINGPHNFPNILFALNPQTTIASSGTVSAVYGMYDQIVGSGSAAVTNLAATYSNVYLSNPFGGSVAVGAAEWADFRETNALQTVALGSNFYGQSPSNAGGINTFASFYSEAVAGGATNAYDLWADEQGVFRIKADNTFNSVYQAIPALYNPQFAKYTPGAADFERCIPGCQWESNAAVITTEKGGTGTLRNLQLGDASVHVLVSDLKTTGAATGKKVVCVDTATGQLYASSTGTDCSN